MIRKRIVEVVIHSLDIEAHLDGFSTRLFSTSELDGLPNFKQLRLVPIKKRLGSMFQLWPVAAATLVPTKILCDLLLIILARTTSGKRPLSGAEVCIFGFFETNAVQLCEVIAASAPGHLGSSEIQVLTRRNAAATLSWGQLREVVGSVATICLKGIAQRAVGKGPSLIHLHNVVDLTLGATVASTFNEPAWATANMFQHRAFVLAHAAKRCWIIQHGLIDRRYEFPHKFPTVDSIFVLDADQVNDWLLYLDAHAFVVQAQKQFDENPLGSDCVLLASSAPFAAEEMEFLDHLRTLSEAPIAIKLHPAHNYGPTKSQLITRADYRVRPDENLKCCLFVSHSSTYELHYSRNGTPIVRLEHFATPVAAARAAAAVLESEGASSSGAATEHVSARDSYE